MNEEDYVLLKQVQISKGPHQRTGNTAHYVDGKLCNELPYELKILKYRNIEGVYLIHYDKNGIEITDTFHENAESAMEQAKFEFGINENEWL